MRAATAIALGAVLLLAIATASAQEEDKGGDLGLTSVDRGFTWTDQQNEAAYHVRGHIGYVSSSCANRGDLPTVSLKFDERLPKDTTLFLLPVAGDPLFTKITGLEMSVSAVDASGEPIASSSMAATVEHGCSPEEIAAAGSGPGPAGSDALALASMALAAFGAAAIGGALLSRRRRAR